MSTHNSLADQLRTKHRTINQQPAMAGPTTTMKTTTTMRSMITTGAFAVAALLTQTQAYSQEQPITRNLTGQNQAEGSQVIINQVDSSAFPKVTIFATVLKDGKPFKGLGANDFVVREDEVEQEPLTVVPKLTPLSTVLALDVSGSMSKRLPLAKTAATGFIDSLNNEDKVKVISFARTVKDLNSGSQDRSTAKQAIQGTVARGDTALYDALYASVDALKDRTGRKAVILLSDGADDNGAGGQLSKRSIDEVLTLAKQVNVPIYTIGVGTNLDEAVLSRVASETGARYLATAQPEQLTALYAQISEQLSGQYNIHYTSNLPGDGTEHRVNLAWGDASGSKSYLAPTVQKEVAQTQPQPAPAPQPTVQPVADVTGPKVDLLSKGNGGSLLIAPHPDGVKIMDGNAGSYFWYANAGQEFVFGFDKNRPATIDEFQVHIPKTHQDNLKDFELLVADDSPLGNFKSIGKFSTQNIRMMPNEGFQSFKFNPVTARYLKLRVLSNHKAKGNTSPIAPYEIRVMGSVTPGDAMEHESRFASAPEGPNMLAPANGGVLLTAPHADWAKATDGNNGSYFWYANAGQEGVYQMNNGGNFTISTFGIHIPKSHQDNVNEFELLVSNESPTEGFQPIGKFQTVNASFVKNGGWQYFSFPPVEGKYLKVRMLTNHKSKGNTSPIAPYEFSAYSGSNVQKTNSPKIIPASTSPKVATLN